METRKVKWKPTTKGGGIGAEVEFEMREDDYAEMKERQQAALALPEGQLRLARLNEFRTLMDLFALGETTIARPAVARSTDIPRPAPAPVTQPPAPAPAQLSTLVAALPDFDGETYQRALDHERLGNQFLRVARLMGDGGWKTLAEISGTTGDPEASVSARLRDLRKAKFGGHTVERERLGQGLFRYRLIREDRARPWEETE